MTSNVAKVPDYLAQLAHEVAKRENLTVDQVVAAALASQVDAWRVRGAIKAGGREEPREHHMRSYEKWEPPEDENLRKLFNSGASVNEIARKLQRRPNAVRSRLAKLRLF
jgi:hypothetical protein